MKFYFTIDVDWIPGSQQGLADLLKFCRRFGLPATLFVAGRFALDYPEYLDHALQDGHEIGCHGWEHGLNNQENYLGNSYEEQRQCIARATAAIARVTGVAPVMFRAPNLWVSETTFRVLTEEGYRLDSSVPARRFDFGYGQCNYLKYFNAPLAPYHPSARHLGHPGESPILEVPPSAYLCVPINMSGLRVLGRRLVSLAVRRLSKISPVLVFYLHPGEFVPPGEQQVPANEPRRYRRGLGPENFALLQHLVSFILSLGYQPRLLSEEIDGPGSGHHER